MRILLYEHVTAGGDWLSRDAGPAAGSLLAEGSEMLRALADDLSRTGRVHLVVFADARLPDLFLGWSESQRAACEVVTITGPGKAIERLLEHASRCDAALLIAPEFAGRLFELTRCLENLAVPLLCPDSDFVKLTADKHACGDYLAAGGIAVPQSRHVTALDHLPADFVYPAVLKPVDGAGSVDVRLISHPEALRNGGEAPGLLPPGGLSPRNMDFSRKLRGSNFISTAELDRGRWRLESFQPGTAASVAVLCGAAGVFPLEPCRQLLSDDGCFAYRGGVLPLEGPLRARAIQLAMDTMQVLPRTRGYVGIDLVLGDTWQQDVVIEVNPRITTSYVGLRQRVQGNLAGALLDVCHGGKPDISFSRHPLEFQPRFP